MSKHTPGPWGLNWDFGEIDCIDGRLNDLGQNEVAPTVCYMPRGHDCEADARLIAAAPDLLEALKELVARCDGPEGVRADGSNLQTMAAHAAIAKAEGES